MVTHTRTIKNQSQYFTQTFIATGVVLNKCCNWHKKWHEGTSIATATTIDIVTAIDTATATAT